MIGPLICFHLKSPELCCLFHSTVFAFKNIDASRTEKQDNYEALRKLEGLKTCCQPRERQQTDQCIENKKQSISFNRPPSGKVNTLIRKDLAGSDGSSGRRLRSDQPNKKNKKIDLKPALNKMFGVSWEEKDDQKRKEQRAERCRDIWQHRNDHSEN